MTGSRLMRSESYKGDETRVLQLRRGNMPLKALCVATALIAATQMPPASAQFMQEMNASMELMHRRMAGAPMTGNVDHDFASMMIPHHQGAIDMAKAELICGKDPVMRRLAQEILVDQQSEIDAMRLWLGNTTAGKPDKEK